MRFELQIHEFHIHLHIHDDDNAALLKRIEELQTKVTEDTQQMTDAVDSAKDGTVSK